MYSGEKSNTLGRQCPQSQNAYHGNDPDTVDFSDPALPPGMSAEKIRAGVMVAMEKVAERGWDADDGYIRPDETAGPEVERQLGSKNHDCILVGAGVRSHRRLAMLEGVVSAIHKTAPNATNVFNTRPGETADAAARWLRDEKPMTGAMPKSAQTADACDL